MGAIYEVQAHKGLAPKQLSDETFSPFAFCGFVDTSETRKEGGHGSRGASDWDPGAPRPRLPQGTRNVIAFKTPFRRNLAVDGKWRSEVDGLKRLDGVDCIDRDAIKTIPANQWLCVYSSEACKIPARKRAP